MSIAPGIPNRYRRPREIIEPIIAQNENPAMILSAKDGNQSSNLASFLDLSNIPDLSGDLDSPDTDIETNFVRVKLASRIIVKRAPATCTASLFAELIMKEHRLELDNINETDDVILWEHIDGTRRPLRPSELISRLIARWEHLGGADAFYVEITDASLRDRVDSLASLVPRRDMLRAPPEFSDSDVHFFLPMRKGNKGWFNKATIYFSNGLLTLCRGNRSLIQLRATESDVYEVPKAGPAKYLIVLRNRAVCLYLSTHSARTFSLLRNAIYTARTQALLGQTFTSTSN